MLTFIISIYFVLYYLRPAEWVPGLIGTPLLLGSGVISLVFISFGAISGRFPNVFSGQVERMMFGFTFAIVLSHLSHFYIGGAINAFNTFLPTLTGFFLVLCFVDSRERLHFFLMLLILLTTCLAYEGWLQYTTGYSHGHLEPLYQKEMMPGGETYLIPRIRWFGVFNDPNDVGLALVIVIPFLLNMLQQRRYIVPLVTLPLIVAAIYYTNSRGTVLAGLVSIGSYFVIRYRSVYGVLAGGLFGIILFLFGPSRMSSVSASEESAYGRIDAWYQAYQMFKTYPLFGVGQGMFIDYHNLTAHNSFVLVMAELGFVGLLFFTGLFYFPYYWLWINIFTTEKISLVYDDLGLICAAYGSLTGMIASMFFLSRSYILLPFMLVAMVTDVTRLMDSKLQFNDSISDNKPRHYKNILLLTFLQIIGINIIVKLLV